MNKFQNALYRFMSGRYGSDQLNNFLLIFALILLILNLFVIRNPYLATIIWIILIINIFRPRASLRPSVCPTRSFISRAALLVKVTAAMCRAW